jgi:hypothetical protein
MESNQSWRLERRDKLAYLKACGLLGEKIVDDCGGTQLHLLLLTRGQHQPPLPPFKPMLRINDILVWIRIWIRGPCLWIMDPDPDSAIFVIDLQDANKKLILKKIFFLNLFKGTFLTIFALWYIKGSGSIPLTNGSGSRRPKNIWIRRIRIRNTSSNTQN